jgi:16S rRNA G966 N2-methylase RsmD
MRVEQALPVLEGPYQLVLADPPYNLTNMNHMIELLSRPGLVDPAGLVVVEHSSRVAVPEECGTLQRRDQRRYGDTELSIYGHIYSPTYSKEGT